MLENDLTMLEDDLKKLEKEVDQLINHVRKQMRDDQGSEVFKCSLSILKIERTVSFILGIVGLILSYLIFRHFYE